MGRLRRRRLHRRQGLELSPAHLYDERTNHQLLLPLLLPARPSLLLYIAAVEEGMRGSVAPHPPRRRRSVTHRSDEASDTTRSSPVVARRSAEKVPPA